ncbi:transglutaminase family protein [Catenovulum sp. 2E275]|uniref:transglutaminase family protein n=1 Tax=Catenovulum sp. 2E275 TaxID=2980497 RepID=UPI0021D1D6DA|nr:transglutaminase family protein [Catenovulum sp. 2E275]MCU4674119.1 transglutaminase family protein [Catenovulum sp. 2E275]
MTITVGITHHTEYEYDKAITLDPHLFRLRPAPHCRTPIKSYSLKIYPENHFINWQQDPFGNYLARVVFPEKTDKFWFTVDLIAEMTVINPFDFFVESYAEKIPFEYPKQLKLDLAPYLETLPVSKPFQQLIDSLKPKQATSTVDFIVAANQKIYQMIAYGIRMEPGVQTVDETLEKKSGSCRDSAWLLVQLCRNLGLAARFVSGYLVQLTPDQKSLDGPSGPETDFTDLHAWTEIYIPGAGWVGLDPTSGLFAGEGHIPLACTPEPSTAAPVTGALEPCKTVNFEFANKVKRLHEMPRVTKPYSQVQWAEIYQLGLNVDQKLNQLGIELTMGGEPTFISIDDMESAQWNTAADGADKRRLAHHLFLKMQEAFSIGSLRHYGQGKWYPGEALPRWQYACYWRKDGEAIWHNNALLADINQNYQFSPKDAQRFAAQLAANLGFTDKAVTTAYEDILYHLWQEGCMPLDPSPDEPDLLHAMSRKGFLAKMEQGIENPVGYILPVQWDFNQNCWQSCIWQFKRGYCFLLPGDSPMGYRLPLASLTGTEPFIERDPFSIPERFEQVDKQNKQPSKEKPYLAKQHGYVGDDLLKTALTVEVRNGKLYLFMPPLSHSEHYLKLVNAIEATAEQLTMPVVLEGYTPPTDSRIEKFAVTPDPGVIEVNIHPSNNWGELVERTQILYELAKQCRLGTDKFMIDGRHTGTGGGNHVTMGAKTPLNSPFLRKPDVLRSFITYWQHHPGLSYLFSGLFIGPTSQAPRVDEARDELLYELEIAFSHMPAGEVPQPWLVDRLLRNLLVDLTGNTHRAEFCIDKLYSPDSASGRLGLVEFRGFEMPPHERMSMMQMLLLRTLLVWFWQQPYHKPLVRWGTELHDKFLLPEFVKQDISTVCRDLQQAGFNFNLNWFEPFFEFRFPRCGIRQIDQVELELRTAIEPWHVLGEESTSSGTSRYVDSSLERVQIKVKGLVGDRYIVTCNGRRVPMRSAGEKSTMVGGIRYRAWQPASALHPTIGVHAPLVFDVHDSWQGRSIGGFTYHVSHPGGRNFATFPVNAFEAEGRRLARFWDHGHSPNTQHQLNQHKDNSWHPSQMQYQLEHHQAIVDFTLPPEESVNNEYPHTLDLRTLPKFK